MTNKTGGGAATNSGIDYQQRVAAFFVLAMALDLDCSNILERDNEAKIFNVSFETGDSIDDIVVTHKDSKSYLQVKRKLSLSERTDSDFYKTIDQFVRQYRKSKNNNDCYVLATSSDSSKKILSDLRKITIGERLSHGSLRKNPRSKTEEQTYQTLRHCLKQSLNSLGDLNHHDRTILNIIRKIHIVILDIENNGPYEKAFLASITSRLNTDPKLLWGYLVSKTLDWSKNRLSVDIQGINSTLNKFIAFENTVKDNFEEERFFKLEFAPDKYELCSGRELVIIDSLLPEFDICLLELYRFDEQGNFRLKFHEDEIEFSDGSKYKLHGRFSTYTGAERFIADHDWLKEKKVMIGPINGKHDFDASQIAIAYSEKTRRKILENKDNTKCIHCEGGITSNALLVEVEETGLPFDAGLIHRRCVRRSDRVLGSASNPGFDIHPELLDFDYQKWFLHLSRGQAVWCGVASTNDPIKHIAWNSEAALQRNGHLCIKAVLVDGSFRYVQERGRVQRYGTKKAKLVCDQLNNWIADAKHKKSPLCYSEDGDIQGMSNTLQSHSNEPLDLIECSRFEIAQYTRGISQIQDKVKNFYAPLIYLSNIEDSTPLTYKDTVFLSTSPMDLKKYLKNWSAMGFDHSPYKINIVPQDQDFDRFILSCFDQKLQVLVDPFFDQSGQMIKGSVIEDIRSLTTPSETPYKFLFIIDNNDGTFTQIYRNFDDDETLLFTTNCTSDSCDCHGCQIYSNKILVTGMKNTDIKTVSPSTIAITLDDGEYVWDDDFILKHRTNWSEWENIIFASFRSEN
jgi:hypothetical protein